MTRSIWFGAAGAIFVVWTAAVTVRYQFVQPAIAAAPHVAIADGAAARLAAAIRIRTISADDPASFDAGAFEALHKYLQLTFPLVHSSLQRETVSRHSLLYTWRGTDPSLRPILLAGHLDVVPVETSTEEKWTHPPFCGCIVNGFVWGRGSIDNKSSVVGVLEAVEMLLADGFQPKRTVHLAFGHDEEVGGLQGAASIAALLKARGVELEMVLDEGGVIGDGLLAGMTDPVALVGIAEKGFATFELSTRGRGGHSSLPPSQTAVGILSAAVARLEANQMPARLDGPTRQLFDRVGPMFPFPQRLLFANLWLTRPLVVRALEDTVTTNAMVRTTTALTMFEAGTKDNVLPSYARAVVNYRIRPGSTIAAVGEHVRETVDDDRVTIRLAGRFSSQPSSISSTDSSAFRALERAIRGVARGTVVAPYLVVVVTDARHYSELSPNIFRFLPLRMTATDLHRMHGIDERVGIAEYEEAIRIYHQLILEAAGS
jgi:carboxypeptidase PM20D1